MSGSKFRSLTLFFLLLYFQQSSSETSRLLPGSSLSVENPSDVLISPRREFSAGFFKIGENAYSFAIWFTGERATSVVSHDLTVVWMANREIPVNGKLSKLLFRKSGELQLTDAGQTVVWSHNTTTTPPGELKLLDTGNLVLTDRNGAVSWRSFDSPTDTLLPGQELVKTTKLVSSRSRTDYSTGSYELFFDDDNVLRLLYKSPEITSIYWPDPWLRSWEAQRYIFNDTRVALLNSSGSFLASDSFNVMASDYGAKLQRRLTIGHDGNLRLYSRRRATSTWVVTWVAVLQPCKIHGICGPNSLCTYLPKFGRKCSCIPGFKMIKDSDQTQGCEPNFELPCAMSTAGSAGFARLPNVEFYGYDKTMFFNYTLKQCESECLNLCDRCVAIHYKFDTGSGVYFCYVKLQMRNGYHTPGFNGDMYLKLPKTTLSSLRNLQPDYTTQDHNFNCSSSGNATVHRLDRTYREKHSSSLLEFLIWFAIGVGGLEVLVVFTVWFSVIRGRENSGAMDDIQGYIQAATGFRKFGYSELKKATKSFSQEIGNGAGGTVYKATLSDNRVAAVKRLKDSNRAELEFLAEVSIIGRLNHMNLIEMWGYCAEGKHRLLVYEFMEHGSLSDSLSSTALDWEKRFEIAVGTAKGLAYLHEECLEWVLHCDVKPQNILLGYNYQPKVADFGLSKLLNRSETGANKNSSFSRIRGTRGYMAPEWVYNLPITSKVDVYSYGIVVLEILTGKNPSRGVNDSSEEFGVVRPKMLVTWMREKISGALSTQAWIEEIIDPTVESKYNVKQFELLVQVALRCVEEDRDLRPTMTQVVEMLLSYENDN